MGYETNCNPSPRWYSAHIFIREALNIVKGYENQFTLSPNIFINEVFFKTNITRALRALHGLPPVGLDNQCTINELDGLMDGARYDELEALLSYQHRYVVGGNYSYGVPNLYMKDTETDALYSFASKEWDKPEVKEKIDLTLRDRKRIIKQVINVACDEFYDEYYKDKAYDIEYYSPLEDTFDTDEIVELILRSGICNNKEEIYTEFGFKDKDGNFKVEIDFFSTYYYRYFKPIEFEMRDDNFRGLHQDFFIGEVTELDNIKSEGF